VRDRLVPDELVDQVGGLPEARGLEPVRVPEALQRLGE
jgi:hypothetical protein